MKKQDIQSIDISYVERSELPHRVRFSDGTASGIDGSGITLGHALFAAVRRVDTWIHIDPADPDTLPPFNTWVLLAVHFDFGDEMYQARIGGGNLWYDKNGTPIRWAFPAIEYAWQLSPDLPKFIKD